MITITTILVRMFGLPKRSNMVVCVCHACASLNPLTGRYEGKIIPRATRDSHKRGDKIRGASNKAKSAKQAQGHSQNETPATSQNQDSSFEFNRKEREAQSEKIRLIKEEIGWLSELPLTSSTAPLIFKRAPQSNGEFRFPSDAEIMQPNCGFHALQTRPRANAAFLHTENRYCELLTILQAEPHLETNDVEDTKNLVLRELERMSHEKALQWAQQRGMVTSGPTLVNTGMYDIWLVADYANFSKFRDTLLPPRTPQPHPTGIRCCVPGHGKYFLYSSPSP